MSASRIPTLALAALLLAGALPLLASPASACTRIPPEPFERIEWLENGTLATQHAYTAGHFGLANRSFTPLADVSPTMHFTSSPDGKWLAYDFDDPEPLPSDPSAPVSTCANGLGAVEVVDTLNRTRVKLLDGSAYAMASDAEGILLAHASTKGLLFVPWGNWSRPQVLAADLPASSTGFNASQIRYLALSPDGTTFAASSWEGPVYVFNRSTGRYVDPERPALDLETTDPVEGLAYSPDGRFLAIGTTGGSRFSELHLAEVTESSAQLVGNRPDREQITGLTWGPEGLAVGYTYHPKEYEGSSPIGVVRVFPEVFDLTRSREETFQNATLSGGMAWAPEGDRLAVGLKGQLLVLDDRLESVRLLKMDPADPAPDLPYAGELGGNATIEDVPDTGNGTSPTVEDADGGTSLFVPGPGALAAALLAGAAAVWFRRR